MHLSSSHVFISSWANIHHDGIERMHSASARICTALATWSSGFFNKTKQCRRVATRYDKLAANYLACLIAVLAWLIFRLLQI